jgi:predicted nuclease of restriction endonuclease-like (RecB) superfamily
MLVRLSRCVHSAGFSLSGLLRPTGLLTEYMLEKPERECIMTRKLTKPVKSKSAANKPSPLLIRDLRQFISETRQTVAATMNAGLTLLYWRIGNRIINETLGKERAAYGQQIVVSLARQLVQEYGPSFGEKNLRRMMQFAEVFPQEEIVVSLIRQLSWTHFIALLPIKNPLQRDFYAELCRVEGWSVSRLRQKIDSMLFERTALSRKPEKLARKELDALRAEDKWMPDMVFRDPYILDFLKLSDRYSEHDLETAILRDIEAFLLEMGGGFSFVTRQKRMVIDGEDHTLDLLFYHRRLQRLVAVELKLGKFKAAYKGQMELYLRWLEENEQESNEESPLGLILCAEGGQESIALLRLDQAGIRVGQYLTELPPKKVLERKLHESIALSRALLESRTKE